MLTQATRIKVSSHPHRLTILSLDTHRRITKAELKASIHIVTAVATGPWFSSGFAASLVLEVPLEAEDMIIYWQDQSIEAVHVEALDI